jgi:hypothetical protein
MSLLTISALKTVVCQGKRGYDAWKKLSAVDEEFLYFSRTLETRGHPMELASSLRRRYTTMSAVEAAVGALFFSSCSPLARSLPFPFFLPPSLPLSLSSVAFSPRHSQHQEAECIVDCRNVACRREGGIPRTCDSTPYTHACVKGTVMTILGTGIRDD